MQGILLGETGRLGEWSQSKAGMSLTEGEREGRLGGRVLDLQGGFSPGRALSGGALESELAIRDIHIFPKGSVLVSLLGSAPGKLSPAGFALGP